MKKFINLCFIGLMLSSCTRHELTDLNLSSSYFPNDIGNYWTYRLTGENGDIDTVVIRIVDKTILSFGDEATIWELDFGHSIDTNYVVDKNNTVTIYNAAIAKISYNTEQNELMKYSFPLQVENELVYNNLKTKVTNQTDIKVEAGSFLKCFQITYSNQGLSFNSINDTIFFKESIGIIKRYQHQYNLTPIKGNGIWELISYHLE